MSDPFNHPKQPSPPEVKFNGEQKDDKGSKNGYEIYNEGINALKEEGYYCEPAQDGKYALHNIRIREHPDPSGQIKGLQIPSSFWMWRRIDYKDPRHEAELLGRVIKGWEEESPELAKFFNPLVYPTTGKSKPIFAIADTQIRQKAEEEVGSANPHKDQISLSGGKGAISFVPRHEWFRDDIRELEAGDLVTFLPEPELKVFLNILGRVVVGRNHSETVEGTYIDHTFRAFCILVGLKGGIGKSTLMNHINSALKFLGYTVADMPSFDRPFGWAKVVRSNLGYIDDLVPSSQKKFIGNELTKQIVSNGLCTTEQKGIDPVENLAKTVLIANSNSFNPTDLMGLDDGVLSRLNLLQCHDYSNIQDEALVSDASKDSPDYRTREHWIWLQEKYGLNNSIALGCWLLRLAADEFLDNCGYVFNEQRQRYDKSNDDQLEMVMRRNRLFFKIGNIQNASEHLMVFNHFLYSCLIQHPKFDDLQLRKTDKFNSRLLFILSSYSLNCILTYQNEDGHNLNIVNGIRDHYYHVKDYPEYHPFRAMDILDGGGCIKVALQSATEAIRMKYTYPDALKQLYNTLRTEEGFRLIGEPVWLKRFWDFAHSVKSENEQLIQDMKGVFNTQPKGFGDSAKTDWQIFMDSIYKFVQSFGTSIEH